VKKFEEKKIMFMLTLIHILSANGIKRYLHSYPLYAPLMPSHFRLKTKMRKILLSMISFGVDKKKLARVCLALEFNNNYYMHGLVWMDERVYKNKI
jgi:hypothetical protein